MYIQVETFPQHIQTTAMGFIEIIGQPAKVVAPYLVELADDNEITPIGIMSIFCFVFMILTFLPVK